MGTRYVIMKNHNINEGIQMRYIKKIETRIYCRKIQGGPDISLLWSFLVVPDVGCYTYFSLKG